MNLLYPRNTLLFDSVIAPVSRAQLYTRPSPFTEVQKVPSVLNTVLLAPDAPLLLFFCFMQCRWVKDKFAKAK